MSETVAEIIEDREKARRLTRRRVLTTVVVVALVSLSALSSYLYLRMDDYRDDDYRFQWFVINGLGSSVTWIGEHTAVAANTSIPLEERAIAATQVWEEYSEARDLVYAIRETYPVDSEENTTFSAIDRAISAFYTSFWYLRDNLVDNVTEGESMVELPDINLKLLAAVPLLYDLSDAILDSILEGEVYSDFDKDPSYSVVERLDQEQVRGIADSIFEVFANQA